MKWLNSNLYWEDIRIDETFAKMFVLYKLMKIVCKQKLISSYKVLILKGLIPRQIFYLD